MHFCKDLNTNQMPTKTKTERVLNTMLVISWIAFIGLMIEAGAILFSYGVSIVNSDAPRVLYPGLGIFESNQFGFGQYTLAVSVLTLISAFQAFLCYLVIQILSKVNLTNPFVLSTALKLKHISFVLMAIWVLSLIQYVHLAILSSETLALKGDVIPGEYLFVAGLVYIIAQVFKRGVEMQTESDLDE